MKVQSHFELNGFDFIDLGSGKGKATLYARKFELLGNNDRYFGIDFEKSLVEIAEKNSTKMFGDEGRFFYEDVVKVDWERFSEKILIFMYNPFNSIVLRQVLASIENKKVIIIYVNPVENQTILDNGYECFHSFSGWHANLTYTVFAKNIAKKGVRK